MRLTSKYFYVCVAFVFVLALIFFTTSFLINVGSTEVNTFYLKEVNGVPNFSNPGGESFWQNVPTVTVPAVPSSNYAPSGATSQIEVQMAWTSSTPTPELLVKMQFANYGSSASYASPLNVYVNNSLGVPGSNPQPMYANLSCTNQFSSCFGMAPQSGASLNNPASAAPAFPQDTGLLPLATGTQYVYPEQAIVLFGMSPGANTDAWYNVSYKPKLTMGSSGALDTGSGGQAEAWIWSSNPTDNSSQDSGYPGMSYPNGTAVNTADFGLPAHASYAIDGYLNASAFFQLGGLPGTNQFLYINNPTLYTNNPSSIGQVSYYMNPFEVQAKGVYNPSTNSWTVEFARSLTTPPNNGENNYQLQMNPSNPSNYYIAFEVNQGQASETYLIYYGSVSFWWRFNFQHTPGYVGYNQQYGSNAVYALTGMLVGIVLTTWLDRSRKGNPLPFGRMLLRY